MSMSGLIEVKRGNLQFGDEYMLKNVPSVCVTGGSFMMDPTVEASLGGLTSCSALFLCLLSAVRRIRIPRVP